MSATYKIAPPYCETLRCLEEIEKRELRKAAKVDQLKDSTGQAVAAMSTSRRRPAATARANTRSDYAVAEQNATVETLAIGDPHAPALHLMTTESDPYNTLTTQHQGIAYGGHLSQCFFDVLPTSMPAANDDTDWLAVLQQYEADSVPRLGEQMGQAGQAMPPEWAL